MHIILIFLGLICTLVNIPKLYLKCLSVSGRNAFGNAYMRSKNINAKAKRYQFVTGDIK